MWAYNEATQQIKQGECGGGEYGNIAADHPDIMESSL
jgi:hypothetical protein